MTNNFINLSMGGEVSDSPIQIPGSKSETNRYYILQARYPNIAIEGESKSDDSLLLQRALELGKGTIDIENAGTAMRFLTAYFASKPGARVLLTGSDQMKRRPIEPLVTALRELGADLTYTEERGFPPLQINGKSLKSNDLTISGELSSQYISALLLIATGLPLGLKLTIDGELSSQPYVDMTLSMLSRMGVFCEWDENEIHVHPMQQIDDFHAEVESDWSSASYFYSYVALSESAEVRLSSFSRRSLQGDSAIVTIFEALGVHTTFEENDVIRLNKTGTLSSSVELNLVNTPDLAQTIAVCCFGLSVPCKLTGLQTLPIKETDRLKALDNELGKLGAKVVSGPDHIQISPAKSLPKSAEINTYGDHRMALAFAPLVAKFSVSIQDPEVVSKSYPDFWEHLEQLGIVIERQI